MWRKKFEVKARKRKKRGKGWSMIACLARARRKGLYTRNAVREASRGEEGEREANVMWRRLLVKV